MSILGSKLLNHGIGGSNVPNDFVKTYIAGENISRNDKISLFRDKIYKSISLSNNFEPNSKYLTVYTSKPTISKLSSSEYLVTTPLFVGLYIYDDLFATTTSIADSVSKAIKISNNQILLVYSTSNNNLIANILTIDYVNKTLTAGTPTTLLTSGASVRYLFNIGNNKAMICYQTTTVLSFLVINYSNINSLTINTSVVLANARNIGTGGYLTTYYAMTQIDELTFAVVYDNTANATCVRLLKIDNTTNIITFGSEYVLRASANIYACGISCTDVGRLSITASTGYPYTTSYFYWVAYDKTTLTISNTLINTSIGVASCNVLQLVANTDVDFILLRDSSFGTATEQIKLYADKISVVNDNQISVTSGIIYDGLVSDFDMIQIKKELPCMIYVDNNGTYNTSTFDIKGGFFAHSTPDGLALNNATIGQNARVLIIN